MSTRRDDPTDQVVATEEPSLNLEQVSSHDSATSDSSRSSRRRIPVSRTAAYTWLSVQKIMEHSRSASDPVLCHRPALQRPDALKTRSGSELLDHPRLPESPVITITRMDLASVESTIFSSRTSDGINPNLNTYFVGDSTDVSSSNGDMAGTQATVGTRDGAEQ